MPKGIRCKHSWERIGFIGDPLVSGYYCCEVQERCTLCNTRRSRTSTEAEHQAEFNSRICSKCKLPKADHICDDCVSALIKKINELDERLSDLERWKNG